MHYSMLPGSHGHARCGAIAPASQLCARSGCPIKQIAVPSLKSFGSRMSPQYTRKPAALVMAVVKGIGAFCGEHVIAQRYV